MNQEQKGAADLPTETTGGNTPLKEIARRLLEEDDFRILCHAHPDGDAIGSAEALRRLLGEYGKKAAAFCADPAPSYLRFLTGENFFFLKTPEELPTGGCYLAVDTAEPALLGGLSPLADRVFVKIDHHRVGKPFGRFAYTDPTAAATGEILFSLAMEMTALTGRTKEEAVSRPVAEALYAALTSDTGCFRYSNTTEKSFRIAGRLLQAGAPLEKIHRQLFESKPLSQWKATATGLCRMEQIGRAAVVLITERMKEEGGFSDEDLGELSSVMREIDGIDLAVRILQTDADPCRYRLSCRSKEPLDCTRFCAMFGGGGHLRAAGASFSARSPEEALTMVKAALARYFTEIPPEGV